MKILILAAHCDDEILGCGATAAKLANESHSIIPVIFCESASIRYPDHTQDQLEEWCKKCAQILGISPPVFLGLPDQKLDSFSSLQLVQTLEKIIKDYQPEIIFTHHGGDINKDHQIVFDTTMVAARPVPKSMVRTIYSYETISSTEWSATEYYARFHPNTFHDVSKTIQTKLEAFSQYKLEVRRYPHPRSLEAIEIRAKDWGAKVGIYAAEPFQLIRTLV